MFLPITILTNILINRYFNTHCVLLLQDSDSISIYNFATIQISPENLTDIVYKDSERCLGFVIASNKPLKLLEIIEKHLQRKPGEARYNTRKYIIFLKESKFIENFNEGVLDYIVDVLFVEELDGFFNFSTHKYIGVSGRNEFVSLDIWFVGNETFLFGADLFPDKLKDQAGRNCRIGAVQYLPYSFVEKRKGTELLLTLEYLKRNNMTSVITPNNNWGDIYPNWTGDGVLGSLVEDELDISLGALFALPERVKYSDFTQATVYSRVTCLVPLPKAHSGWLTPISVFKHYIWILFFISYAIIVLCAYISTLIDFSGKNNKRLDRLILSTFARFMAQSQDLPKTKSSFSSRFLCMITLILSLLFSISYSSRLSSSMVIPRFSDDINTVSDLANSNIDWGELTDDWAVPLQIDLNEDFQKTYKKFKVLTWQQLKALSEENNFAFGIEKLPSGYYAIGDYINLDVIHNYKVMEEDLYQQYAAMQLRKNSVMLPSLNMFLLWCGAAGLLLRWEAETSRSAPNISVQRRILYPSKQKVIRLKFSHIKGAFALWAFGLLIATSIFIYEIKKKTA